MLYLSHLISAASGKLNGLVASRNRGGSYMREHVIPIDPETARQVNCRDAMIATWMWWSDEMTTADREGWEFYAKSMPRTGRLAVRRELPGWQAFCRQHYARFQANEQLGAGMDPGSVPPLHPSGLSAIPTLTYSTDNVYQLHYPNDNNWCLDHDNALLVYISAGQPPTRNYFKGPYQLAAAVVGNSEEPPEFPLNITYGTTPTDGQRIWYRIMFISNDRERAGPFQGRIDIE